MPKNTPNLNLLKIDPLTDGSDTFNIETMLNGNWDKIDINKKIQDERINAVEKNETYTTETLTQDYKSIFSTGTGKDNTGIEQDFSNVVEGQSNVKLEGFTANNLVINGDFSDGIFGWGSIFGAATVKNNILINKGDGSGDYNGLFAVGSPKHIIGHKYYYKLNARVTNSECKAIGGFMGSYKDLVTFPLKDIWYESSAIFDAVAETLTYVHIYHNYVDVVTAEDKVMEIKDIMVIDLTALGLDTLTKEQCDYMFNHYINGLQGVGSGKIVSVGKNLLKTFNFFDWEIHNDGTAQFTNNILTINNPIEGHTTWFDLYLKNPKPNTQFTFSAIHNGTITVHGAMFKGDSGSVSISDENVGVNPTFNTSYYPYIRLFISTTTSVGTFTFKNIQLEENIIATEYEHYQSSELITTLPSGMQLNRLPNGVADTIEAVNGVRQLVKRIRERILQPSDILSIVTSYSNLDYIEIRKPSDYIHYGLYGTTINTLFDRYPTKVHDSEAWGGASDIGYILGEASSVAFWLGVAKGTYACLESAQIALTGINMIYQLAEPITYKNSENGFSQTGNLEVYPKGIIYQVPFKSKESTNAKTTITYNLSDKAMIMSNSKQITRISNEVITPSNPNLLDNGDFQVWQRGTSFTNTIGTFSADRWRFGGGVWSCCKDDNGMFITVTNEQQMQQRIEYDRYKKWIGNPITLSFKTTGIKTKSMQVRYYNIAENKYEFIINKRLSNVQGYYMCDTGILFPPYNKDCVLEVVVNVDQTAGASGVVNWVKLELGSKATPFVPKPYVEELLLCKRYFERVGYKYSGILTNPIYMVSGSSNFLASINYMYKRIIPTLVITDVSNYRALLVDELNGSTLGATSIESITPYSMEQTMCGVNIKIIIPTSRSLYVILQRADGDVNAWIDIDAEI